MCLERFACDVTPSSYECYIHMVRTGIARSVITVKIKTCRDSQRARYVRPKSMLINSRREQICSNGVRRDDLETYLSTPGDVNLSRSRGNYSPVIS